MYHKRLYAIVSKLAGWLWRAGEWIRNHELNLSDLLEGIADRLYDLSKEL